jgi:hypothetical protein
VKTALEQLLFRWSIGRSTDVPVWDAAVFTKNREPLLAGDVTASFLPAVTADPAVNAHGTVLGSQPPRCRKRLNEDQPPLSDGGKRDMLPWQH